MTVRLTEDFDPELVVEIKMSVIADVLQKLDALYEHPVKLGNIVMPNPLGLKARTIDQIGEVMLTLFRALPDVTEREGVR